MGTEIYGQSTNSAGDRSAGGLLLLSRPNAHAGYSIRPKLRAFILLFPIARAPIAAATPATAITHHRNPCNPFSRPCRDAISQRQLRCSSLTCTYRHPRPRYDIILPEICCACTRCFSRAVAYDEVFDQLDVSGSSTFDVRFRLAVGVDDSPTLILQSATACKTRRLIVS